jgi:hypothetical protein
MLGTSRVSVVASVLRATVDELIADLAFGYDVFPLTAFCGWWRGR